LYQSKSNSGATIAMIRAFVTLSSHLRLSKTCEDLNATRQTVRRHINDLERIKGGALFEVVERQYHLTDFGKDCLEDARSLLVQFDAFAGQSSLSRSLNAGLEYNRFVDSDGREFFSQQHSVSKVATGGLTLAREALAAWGDAETRIEHPSLQAIRPYTVLYRKGPQGWVFVDVGPESAYARWFGWTWSKSAIGKLMNEDNVGDEFNEFISGAYSRIYDEGGIRLDHLYAHLPKDGEDPLPVTFQRLLLGCVFPDGTPGLTVLALITNNVEIDAIKNMPQPVISKDILMDDLSSHMHSNLDNSVRKSA